MTQNNEVSNTENGNASNTPQSDRYRDVFEPKQRFLFKEPIVLVSIVCLTLFNGLSLYLRPRDLAEYPIQILTAYSSLASAVPIVGVVFAAFLSEVTGRKPVYLYLFSLTLLSFILLLSSKHVAVIGSMYIIGGLIRGGCSVMNTLTISEYSSPKHRFAWMIVNEAALTIVDRVILTMTLDSETLFYVVIVILIVLGLICLGSFWVWPESPYWLASKGKLEESRKAFMWLRGEVGREEFASLLKARRRPGPPKLFWGSLFIALATISVGIFSGLEVMQSLFFSHHLATKPRDSEFYIFLFGATAFTFILAAVSYLVKRKLLFIVVSIISFILSYAEALWLYLASGSDREYRDSLLFYLLLNASNVIATCGPFAFGLILYIEIAPYKYNTTISCICFSVLFSCIASLMPLCFYLVREISLHPSALLALSTTLALVAALLYYFFAPETKDKTLLEIQRSYTPDENDSIPEQNESMMLNAI